MTDPFEERSRYQCENAECVDRNIWKYQTCKRKCPVWELWDFPGVLPGYSTTNTKNVDTDERCKQEIKMAAGKL